ncbi:MAG TPA: hypothetical protein VMZ66_04155 [Aeromicrobium sp.]|nr:hypothetical protein [Aeromicrobium sp.]
MVEVDGVEWIRVQYGHDRPGDWVNHGWAPSVADIDRGGGTHVDPVYEYVVPDCPEEFTIGELGSMVPALALYCFGSETLTAAPIQVRNEGNELDLFIDGAPEWLALGDGLMAHWLPGYEDLGAAPVYVDPASDIHLPEGAWVELTGHLDHQAAQTCEMTSTEPEIRDLRNDAEAVALCRGRFVVTGVRHLSMAEIPQAPPRSTPGPRPTETVTLALKAIEAPIGTRISPANVWTGEELIIWGGNSWHEDWSHQPEDDGVAYNPATGTWREIDDGPLSPRNAAASIWTGTEMLIWGGQSGEVGGRDLAANGAAYDPSTDTWRKIAPGPLEPSYWTSSIWTGTEWWIADSRRTKIALAAYDPAQDRWRQIAAPSGDADHGAQLVWTGSEIFLMDSFIGLMSFDPSIQDWVNEEVEFRGPIVWTGELFIGSRTDNIATNPLDWGPFSYPVAWDPILREEIELARPPHSVYELLPMGAQLGFGTDLLLDLESNVWFDVDLGSDLAVDTITNRDDGIKVWTGDRLIIWGGYEYCSDPSAAYDIGWEIVPQVGAGGGYLPQLPEAAPIVQTVEPERAPATDTLLAC